MCSEMQLDFIKTLMKATSQISGLIVNIGCWDGKITKELMDVIHPSMLVCNDDWRGYWEESENLGYVHGTVTYAQTTDVFSEFKNTMKLSKNENYIVIKQKTVEWLPTLNQKIKFCYLNTSNDYQSTKQKIEMILPLLAEGGIICGENIKYATKENIERAVSETIPKFRVYDNLWFWKKPKAQPTNL